MLQRISLTYSPFGWVLLPVIVIVSENFVSHSPLAGDLQTFCFVLPTSCMG